jgi:hypothetical protein
MPYDRISRRLRRTALPVAAMALAVGATLSAAAPAMAFEAASPQERAAIRLRVLQSDMVVAALNCDLRTQYNDAIRRFQAELVLHGRHLRAYFDRVHGKRGQAELDRFVTAMANQASSRSIAMGGEYCASATEMMARLLTLPPNSLAEFSRSVVDVATVEMATEVSTASRERN